MSTPEARLEAKLAAHARLVATLRAHADAAPVVRAALAELDDALHAAEGQTGRAMSSIGSATTTTTTTDKSGWDAADEEQSAAGLDLLVEVPAVDDDDDVVLAGEEDQSEKLAHVVVVLPKKREGRVRKSKGKRERSRADAREGQTRYWTAAEHHRFLEAVRLHGEKDYVAIAAYVRTRTAKQARTHAQKFQMKMARLEKSGDPAPAPGAGRGCGKTGRKDGRAERARVREKRPTPPSHLPVNVQPPPVLAPEAPPPVHGHPPGPDVKENAPSPPHRVPVLASAMLRESPTLLDHDPLPKMEPELEENLAFLACGDIGDREDVAELEEVGVDTSPFDAGVDWLSASVP